eukprot:3700347-Ditylum_brightwellii.AAC.1
MLGDPQITLVSREATPKKERKLHQISTPTVTPKEISMALPKTNHHLGDKPADFIRHRGRVYITWVTEIGKEDITLLSMFCFWKPTLCAIHKVSKGGYHKFKNLSEAYETYPDMLAIFFKNTRQQWQS